jgi:hypothetical protein
MVVTAMRGVEEVEGAPMARANAPVGAPVARIANGGECATYC